MRVRAILLGFYEHLRRKPGAEFELASEAAFSSVWMERVDVPSKLPPPKKEKDDRGRFMPAAPKSDD